MNTIFQLVWIIKNNNYHINSIRIKLQNSQMFQICLKLLKHEITKECTIITKIKQPIEIFLMNTPKLNPLNMMDIPIINLQIRNERKGHSRNHILLLTQKLPNHLLFYRNQEYLK